MRAINDPRLSWGEIVSLILSALAAAALTCVWLVLSVVAIRYGVAAVRVLHRAEKFPTVTGQVVRSEVRTEPIIGSKSNPPGTNYIADIRYQYEVNGQAYTGDLIRHEPYLGSRKSRDAETLVASFPKGSEVKVFYDPREPATSLLQPGLIVSDVFPFPVCAVLALGWMAFILFWDGWCNRYLRLRTGTVKVIVRDGRVCARMARHSPVSLTLLIMGALFIAMHGLLFGISRHPRSLLSVVAGTVIVLILSSVVLAWARRRRDSGVDELVIDLDAGTITLPLRFWSKQNRIVEISKIRYLEVVNCSGGRTYYGCPTIFFSDPELESVELASWKSSRRAWLFVFWLKNQLAGESGPDSYLGFMP